MENVGTWTAGLAAIPDVTPVCRTHGPIYEPGRLNDFGEGCSQELSADNAEFLMTQALIGVKYWEDGELERAIHILRHVVMARRQTRFWQGYGLCAIEYILATLYQAAGQADNAVRLLEPSVAFCRRALDQENPERLETEFELAVAYRENGQYKEAMGLFGHVCDIRGRIVTPNHPVLLRSKDELATVTRRYSNSLAAQR